MKNPEKMTVCVWGDSLGKGVIFDEGRGRYAILRENALRLLEQAAPVTVINESVMGRTAPECLAAMKKAPLIPGAYAAIEFGGNDSDMDWAAVAREPEREHMPRTPLPEYRASMRGLVRLARSGGMIPVVVTPLPLDGEKYCRWVSRGLDAEAILAYLGGDPWMMYRWQEQYAAAARDVAWQEGAALLDLRGVFLSDRQFGHFYCRDGIHLNALGQKKLFECILEHLRAREEKAG